MKGDFSRITFDPRKHYSSVRMQQGRVQMDADWNEELDIEAHRDGTTHRDVIGHCGGPLGTDGEDPPNLLAGFLIEADGPDLTISRGRYYVHGVLCENEENASLRDQPDWPTGWISIDGESTENLTDEGDYLLYLDVWQRHLTYLDDDHIREVALGGPDTGTRTKTVWQAKLLRLSVGDKPVNCADFGADWSPVPTTPGKLAARAEPDPETTDPCIVPAEAGFRRLENQLYRVQIHTGGTVANELATFKFSRENGTVVAQWEDQEDDILTVSSPGRDEVLGFSAGDWVEITDDENDLMGTPGVFVLVLKVEGRQLTIEQPSPPLDILEFPLNPKIRRWESKDGAAELTVEIPAGNDGFIELEDGVQIKFDAIGEYRSGDYWVIPARTETGTVEWPNDPLSGSPPPAPEPAMLPPHGIEHHYCPLAIAHFEDGTWGEPSDCRCLFPALKDLKCLYYVSGDGQEVAPVPFSNTTFPLPKPLKVGVSLGRWPVKDATVRFEIVEPPLSNAGLLEAGGQEGTVLPITTDDRGIATCNWSLGGVEQSQQVTATLLDSAGNALHIPITFTANLSRASHVAYDPALCPDLIGERDKTVQAAIDALCQLTGRGGCAVTVGRGGEFQKLDGPDGAIAQLRLKVKDLCICLLPGNHELETSIELIGDDLNLRITGCGPATRLTLGANDLLATGLISFTLKDIWIQATTGFVNCNRCQMVTLDGCRLRGTNVRDALVTIGEAGQIRLSENTLVARVPGAPEPLNGVLVAVGRPELTELLKDPARPDFLDQSVIVAQSLAGRSRAVRRRLSRNLRREAREADPALRGDLIEALEAVAVTLIAVEVDPDQLAAGFIRIRDLVLRGSSAPALIIMDAMANTMLDHNQFDGQVILYGNKTPRPPFDNQSGIEGIEIIEAQTADLQAHNNRFHSEFTVSGGFVVRNAQGFIIFRGTPFRNLILESNVFEGVGHQFAARDVSFSGCDFEFEFENENPPVVGSVYAGSSIYVGTQGISRPPERFFDFSSLERLAAANRLLILEVIF